MNKNFSSILLNIGLLICFASRISAQCSENFDGVTAPALPSGWSAVTLTTCTGSNKWVTSTNTPYNAPNSAFVTAPACVSDEVFLSRYYLITSSSAQLSFQRRHGLEANFDGLVLEISVDGGSFIDIINAGGSFVTGGYNATLFATSGNPLGGRQAWSGSTSNTFITTTLNLPSSVLGRVINFRWRRGTDVSTSGSGVFIDNISITGCSTTSCTENFDAVTVPSLPFSWIAYTAQDCTGSNPWVTVNSQSQTAPNSVFVTAPACISDEYLYSKVFQIVSSTAQITFRRNNALETNFDGMVLEISIGGSSFRDILLAGCTFVTGGYDGLISNCCGNPLGNRSAWTGATAGWVITTINLPASANGKQIILRWRRGTDSSTGTTGAYVDGLSISGSLCSTACSTNITLTPAGGSLCDNNPMVLTASVAGAVYEWYRNDVLLNGVTSNTYSTNTGGIYYVKSIIGGCVAISNVAVLESVPVTPVLNGTGAYCAGSSVSLDIASSEIDQTYTWEKNGIAIYGPVNGNGGSLSYNFTMDASRVGDYVVESAKSGCVNVVSNTANIRLPEIVSGLTVEKLCFNLVTLKWNRVLPGIANQNYEYELSQSATPSSSGTQYADSIISLSVIPSTLYYFHVRYYCGAIGGLSWSSISFTTPTNESITVSPGSGTVCNSTILLTASGNYPEYSWYRNGVLISGETGSTYNASTGGNYKASIIINGCTVESGTTLINENVMVSPSLEGDGVYCTNNFADLRSTTVPTQMYTWYKDGTAVYGPIGGGNGGNQSLVIAVSSITEGSYNVISTKPGCGDITSNTVFVDEARIVYLTAKAICINQASFEWGSVAYGENYQYVVTQNSTPPENPVNPVVTSSTSCVVNSLLPATLYYFHVRAASGPDFTTFCPVWTSIAFTTEATPLPPGTAEWTGAHDIFWDDERNWKCGQIPDANTEVIINGGRPYYPTVSYNLTIKKLTLNSGASIRIPPGVTLTITSQ